MALANLSGNKLLRLCMKELQIVKKPVSNVVKGNKNIMQMA